ncbi:alanine racemase [Ferrimicrobium acidiphilum]|uniref:Alanine racemase n=1 Tax=Ferrimicrobium acidiphilum TaxID=121039 RepID=A0ABV3XYX1_9ACTN
MIPSLRRPTYVEVDLGAIRANVIKLGSFARGSVHIGAVVKADAYGHGAREVAHAAYEAGAEMFFVATLDEALSLRTSLPEPPIVMLGEPDSRYLDEVFEANITPTIHQMTTLKAMIALTHSRHGSWRPALHLEVETGLHRLGSDTSSVLELAALARAHGLEVAGVYSHLARADEGEPGRASVFVQVARLTKAYERTCEVLGYRPLLHMANTAGLLRYPETAFDLVRLGIGMYGYEGPSTLGLRPALRLVSRVVRLHELDGDSGVSYGHRRSLPSGTTIATIPIGYADGVRRNLFDAGGQVLIRGRRHDLAGVVAMDHVMVVVDDQTVAVGDEVVLIGGQGDDFLGADEIASRLCTISYEILTGISDRVPRRYRG